MIIRIIPLMFVGLMLTFCGGSSPEAKLLELAPKFQKVMCSKTIECTKDEMAKIPAQYKKARYGRDGFCNGNLYHFSRSNLVRFI